MILSLAIFFMAVVIHEFAHGWCAYKLGDPTAKYAGRLTLNPLAHIDPVGTVLLPLLLTVMRAPIIFGWAKPVPINFWNFKHPRRDMILVGLSGPLSNILLAFLVSLILKMTLFSPFIRQVLELFVVINLFLAVFNLIPIPPLDGSRVLVGLLPRNLTFVIARLEQFGMLILIVLIWLGLLDSIVWPIVNILIKALLL
ncbi:MAG: site-2 protease family protein [Candidatus Omnitrophota bacterium]|nr:site-2 protease family protein [Candidatus Omnitrophota bacterium]